MESKSDTSTGRKNFVSTRCRSLTVGRLCAANYFPVVFALVSPPAQLLPFWIDASPKVHYLISCWVFFFLLPRPEKKNEKGLLRRRGVFFFLFFLFFKPTYPNHDTSRVKENIRVYACHEHSLVRIYNRRTALKPCYFIMMLSVTFAPDR